MSSSVSTEEPIYLASRSNKQEKREKKWTVERERWGCRGEGDKKTKGSWYHGADDRRKIRLHGLFDQLRATIGDFFRGNFAVVTQRVWRSIGRSHRAESIFHGHFTRVCPLSNDFTSLHAYIYIYIYIVYWFDIIIVCYIWMPLMMIVGQPHATGRCH